MAVDKLVDSAQLDADLGSVADAIRAKSGGTGSLAFPAGFVTEIGNISGGGTSTPDDWMGKEAELFLGPYTIEKTLAETDFATWTPSTSATTTIFAAQDLVSSGTILPNLNEYDYMFRTIFDFQPVRNSGATKKTTVERYVYESVSSLFAYSNGITSLTDKTLSSATNSNILMYWLIYYNSSGTLMSVQNSYGVFVNTALSFSGSYSGASTAKYTLSYLRTPVIAARCSNSYFTTARAAELDQAASKFKIWVGIYRCKRANLLGGVRSDLVELYHNPL